MKHHCRRMDMGGDFPETAAPEGFDGPPDLRLGQGWLTEPEPGFRPARVWIRWQPEGFLIQAELEDAHIFNPVTRFNEPAFLKGDVFEIFLKPEEGEVYYEFHINPHNQLFQYRIPSVAELQARRKMGICEAWLIPQPVLRSRVEVEPEEEKWRIYARIPVEKLDLPLCRPGDRWQISFSRYDYGENAKTHVLSSSSPHQILDFHDQSAWTWIDLV